MIRILNIQAQPTYRYGFQGQERDDEIKGKGNSLNYTYRMHDPRLGRFFAVDPLFRDYPWYTPYQFSGNKVIAFVELEGLEEASYAEKQTSSSSKTVTVITEQDESGNDVNLKYGGDSNAENHKKEAVIHVNGNTTFGDLPKEAKNVMNTITPEVRKGATLDGSENKQSQLTVYKGIVVLSPENFSSFYPATLINDKINSRDNGARLTSDLITNEIDRINTTLGSSESLFEVNITYGNNRARSEVQRGVISYIRQNYPNVRVNETTVSVQNEQGRYVNMSIGVLKPR